MSLTAKILDHGIYFKANGWVLSVQMGGGTYCDNYDCKIGKLPGDMRPEPTDSRDAEIAIWNQDKGARGGMLSFPDGDTVKGRVRWPEILTYWIPLIQQTTAPSDAPNVAALIAARAEVTA